ncbi:MAG: SHOCT domain-containing protein [Ruminiclostridium sp.]
MIKKASLQRQSAKTVEMLSQAIRRQNPDCSAATIANRNGGISIVQSDRVIKCFPAPVKYVEMCLWIILALTANIVLRLVIRKGVKLVDVKYFSGLLLYKTVMIQAKSMLANGLITSDEFSIIETKMCEKFGINSDSLFRETA